MITAGNRSNREPERVESGGSTTPFGDCLSLSWFVRSCSPSLGRIGSGGAPSHSTFEQNCSSMTWARATLAVLDRRGLRGMLGLLATVHALAVERRLCRIRWSGTEWTYSFDGQVLLSNQLIQPRQFDEDLEIFLWDYTPVAGDVILDIGAGTGTEAVPIARRVTPTGRVIAVEAHPGTAAILDRAGPRNGLTNIRSLNAAVTDQPGKVSITDNQSPGTNTVMTSGDVLVASTTIDDLLAAEGIAQVAFLKMNIEGAERMAVLGMSASADRIDRMAISCHDFLGTEWGTTRDEVTKWLTGHGFSVRSRPDDPRPWCRDYLYATRIGTRLAPGSDLET